jgi:hypothetical protein
MNKQFQTYVSFRPTRSSNDVKKHTFDFQGYVFGGMFLKPGFDSAHSIFMFFPKRTPENTLYTPVHFFDGPLKTFATFTEKHFPPRL